MIHPLRQGLRKTMMPSTLAKWGEKILLTENPLDKVACLVLHGFVGWRISL